MNRIVLAALLFAFTVHPALADDKYVFILGARGNPYWEVLADGIKQTAKDKNMDAMVYETDNDTDTEAQLNICQTAAQRKPTVLAMAAMTSAIGLECFKQAAAAGIIVADIDNHLTLDEAGKAGITLAYTVGSDNIEIGHAAAKYVAGAASKSDPKILIIEGAPGNVNGQKRVDGFRAGIKELLPNAIIVASISGEWDRLKSMNLTADLLQREPDLDVVYAANDGMALGAAEAVRNAGKPQIKIIGIDGIADARKAVEDGKLTATVAQLPYLIGMKAATLAYDAAHGQKAGQKETTPAPVLDKAMLTTNTDPLLQYVR